MEALISCTGKRLECGKTLNQSQLHVTLKLRRFYFIVCFPLFILSTWTSFTLFPAHGYYLFTALYIKGNDVTKLASMAKLKGGRLARELSDSCLQYWGGMGYTSDVSVSRFYR